MDSVKMKIIPVYIMGRRNYFLFEFLFTLHRSRATRNRVGFHNFQAMPMVPVA